MSTIQPVGELRIRRAGDFAEFSGRSGGEKSAAASVSTVTRYAPGFVLQIQIDSPSLADLVARYGAAKAKAAPAAAAGAGLPPDAQRPPDRAMMPAAPGGSYKAGDIVVCSHPDGSVPAKPQIAAFLADVDGIQPANPVIGRVEDLAALRRLADAVAQQPVSNELLTRLFTTTVVV
ncbi:hypothetical protein [Sinosporangium siamense]|uniref:Uncharacterized protein n=1 Tax=Sinosporangium siamense TaxID=1367973 RepID=A0A919VBC1_9ACTN|nr:hypothetical protein [Sinosporangium siamense]GII91969.1 hypothetical protein Ssi02_22000 [Sinosporangium siamense]